jgi:hypothetical protein
MSLELLGRIQQELSITGSAIYETVMAMAERANRKVQVLKLHNQASTIINQIEQLHGDLGRQIATFCAKRPLDSGVLSPPSNQLGHALGEASSRVQQLKQALFSVDSLIRELKLETIHQELLSLQQDLSLRAAAIERLTIARGSPFIGRPLSELTLPSSIRLVTVLRGPFLIPPDTSLVLRADDILVLIGLQVDLEQVAAEFSPVRTATLV